MRQLHQVAVAGLLGIGAAAAASAANEMKEFPGDRLLALAGSEFNAAKTDEIRRRLDALFSHLQIPQKTQQRLSRALDESARLATERDQGIPSRFEKHEKQVSLRELTLTVILAKHDVIVKSARDVIIVAGGNVKLGGSDNVAVVAGGSIEVADDWSGGGKGSLFVSRRHIDISNSGAGTIIYAVDGASFKHSANATTYNTDVRGGYGAAQRYIRAPLFSAEPVRRAAPDSMTIDSGPDFAFTGKRCEVHVPEEAVANYILPDARRSLSCGKGIESVTVRCVEEAPRGAGAARRSHERWAVRLCGKTAEYDVRTDGAPASPAAITPSAAPRSAASTTTVMGRTTAPTPAPKSLTPETAAKVQELFKVALAARTAGDYERAMNLYGEILSLDPNNWSAFFNRASARQSLRDYQGAVADFSEALRARQATGFPGNNAQVYASRASAYLGIGDAPKALEDMTRAIDLGVGDPTFLYSRALLYLKLGDFGRASMDAERLIAGKNYRAEAYAVRLWVGLLTANSKDAQLDALSSLAEAGKWTPQRARYQGAAYRVLGGYLAYRQAAQDERAKAWIKEWSHLLVESEWPDSLVLHFLGDVGSDALQRRIKTPMQQAEAAAFRGLDLQYQGRIREARAQFDVVLNIEKGYSLPRVIAQTYTRPTSQRTQ